MYLHPYIAMNPPVATQPPWPSSTLWTGRRQGFARTINETIFIRVNNLTLNRNTDKYNLSHIWDGVLKTPQKSTSRSSENYNMNKCTEHH